MHQAGYNNNGTTTNAGYIQMLSSTDYNNTSTFTSTGVIRAKTISGVNNSGNGSILINNSLPFIYGGTYSGTVKGIFTNTGATTSAGTFTLYAFWFFTDGFTDATSKTLNDPTLIAPTASGTTINSGSTNSLSATCSTGDVKWYDALTGGNLVSTDNPLLLLP